MEWHALDPMHVDPRRLKKEREAARALRATAWWKEKIRTGQCHYCQKIVDPKDLTMDHVVPLARGGQSTRGNSVPSCRACNQEKGLETPVERILRSLR